MRQVVQRMVCGGLAVRALVPAVALLLAGLSAVVAQGGLIVPFETTESSQYLIVGLGPVNTLNLLPGVGQATNVNNFELGANKAPVPSTSDFLEGGSGGGPDLKGNVRDLPANAAEVESGIGGHGNIAITHVEGRYNLQDVGVYGDPDIGIRVAGAKEDADAGTQNSFFNDPNEYPNTFNLAEFLATGESGVKVSAGDGDPSTPDADPSTRIDAPNFAGVHDLYDFTSLLDELFGPTGARAVIPGLAATAMLDLDIAGKGIGPGGPGDASQGTIKDTDFTFSLLPGLNVIDIITSDLGNEVGFQLDKANFVIDGPADSFAIFRLPDGVNFNISNSNVLVGKSGIGHNNVLFYTDSPDNDAHFNFQNAILNGVAFWSLGQSGGVIAIDNSQGCVQLIADKIVLNDVRFNGCEFNDTSVIPEPGSLATWGLGGLTLALCAVGRRWRKRSR